jgi:hypothetical protein
LQRVVQFLPVVCETLDVSAGKRLHLDARAKIGFLVAGGANFKL